MRKEWDWGNVEIMTAEAEQEDGGFPVSEHPSLPPPSNPEHNNRRIVAVLLTLLLAVTLVFTLILVFPRDMSTPSQQLTSSNWSGYCVVSDLSAPQPQVTGVSASWTVPAVSVSIGTSYSAAWVGIGGQYDGTLIQVGTEQDSIRGMAVYSAWYETLPREAVTIDSLNISASDKMTASISLSDRAASTWLIEINDTTNGQSFKESIVYASSMLSAEWIVEAPTLSYRIASLANFGQITFSDCRATIGGETGTISSFPLSQITLNSRQSVTLVTVSALASEGSSFTISC